MLLRGQAKTLLESSAFRVADNQLGAVRAVPARGRLALWTSILERSLSTTLRGAEGRISTLSYSRGMRVLEGLILWKFLTESNLEAEVGIEPTARALTNASRIHRSSIRASLAPSSGQLITAMPGPENCVMDISSAGASSSEMVLRTKRRGARRPARIMSSRGS